MLPPAFENSFFKEGRSGRKKQILNWTRLANRGREALEAESLTVVECLPPQPTELPYRPEDRSCEVCVIMYARY